MEGDVVRSEDPKFCTGNDISNVNKLIQQFVRCHKDNNIMGVNEISVNLFNIFIQNQDEEIHLMLKSTGFIHFLLDIAIDYENNNETFEFVLYILSAIIDFDDFDIFMIIFSSEKFLDILGMFIASENIKVVEYSLRIYASILCHCEKWNKDPPSFFDDGLFTSILDRYGNSIVKPLLTIIPYYITKIKDIVSYYSTFDFLKQAIGTYPDNDFTQIFRIFGEHISRNSEIFDILFDVDDENNDVLGDFIKHLLNTIYISKYLDNSIEAVKLTAHFVNIFPKYAQKIVRNINCKKLIEKIENVFQHIDDTDLISSLIFIFSEIVKTRHNVLSFIKNSKFFKKTFDELNSLPYYIRLTSLDLLLNIFRHCYGEYGDFFRYFVTDSFVTFLFSILGSDDELTLEIVLKLIDHIKRYGTEHSIPLAKTSSFIIDGMKCEDYLNVLHEKYLGTDLEIQLANFINDLD